MSKNKSRMPESLKMEIADEIGVSEKVKANGWRDVSSRDCGNIVKKALEHAEQNEIKKQ